MNQQKSTMPPPRSGYTFRAFFLGSFCAAVLAAGAPYCNMVLRGSYMTQDFSTPGALFLFFFLVGVFNALYKCAFPSGGLARAGVASNLQYDAHRLGDYHLRPL